MQDAKEEVRARLNIEDVIGEYMRLTRAGRSFKGLSPFTQEKTPSFMVSPDKHVWYDFSSNQGGDIFSFVMSMEGLDFRGALELLAQKAGVDLSLYQSGDRIVTEKKQRLRGLLDLATSYYQQTLVKNPHALEYIFKTRELTKTSAQNFKLGFAPQSRSAIVDFLTKKGYSSADIREAGLSNRAGGDLFRSRIIVALCDPSGQVIGFTGRLLGEDKNAPKYLNTPQTLLYDKSRHVFGLDQAKAAIRKQDIAVVVEGNFDVVMSHQVGVTNVVAAAGTALTAQHLQGLKRLTTNICLALDNDRAGLAATERVIPIAQELAVDLKIISLPKDTKDPDDLIRKDSKAWPIAIKEAVPVVDWVLSEYETRYDMSSADGKKQFSSASLSVIKNLKDPIVQEHYLGVVAEKSGTSLEAVQSKFNTTEATFVEARLKKAHQPALAKTAISENEKRQDILLSIAVIDPLVRGLLVELGPADFEGEERQQLFEYFLHDQSGGLPETMPKALHQIETYVKILMLRADARYASWSELDRYDETAKLVRLIKNETLKRRKESLMIKLREAESLGDEAVLKQLKIELNNLIKEMG